LKIWGSIIRYKITRRLRAGITFIGLLSPSLEKLPNPAKSSREKRTAETAYTGCPRKG
jgi:hypothetical protein